MEKWKIRNWEERERLSAEIERLSREYERDVDCIPDEIQCEDFNRILDELDVKYGIDSLILKKFSLEYKKTRNEWFRSFVESFGVCRREISRKQRDIFLKYCEPAHDQEPNCLTYYVNAGRLFVRLDVIRQRAYIEIKEVI